MIEHTPAPGWVRGYWLMLRWEMLGLRMLLPLMMIVQLMVGAGMVIGLGFLFDEVPPEQAVYLATGGSVIALMMLGLVAAPQVIAQHKLSNTYDFMLSLPVSRAAMALASMTVWMLIALPGMVLALGAASLWYDLGLSPKLTLVPAVILTLATATSVGFAFAHAIPWPSVTALLTQILAFGILVYSPINFPPERLPGWLQGLHAWLPLQHAAVVMRGSLIEGTPGDLGRSFAVLAVWAVASWAVTVAVMNRRR